MSQLLLGSRYLQTLALKCLPVVCCVLVIKERDERTGKKVLCALYSCISKKIQYHTLLNFLNKMYVKT